MNNKENSEFRNAITYRGDEFQYRRDKDVFKSIRDKEYVLIITSPFNRSPFPQYDFNGQVYSFTSIMPSNFIEFTETVKIRVPIDKAEHIKKEVPSSLIGLFRIEGTRTTGLLKINKHILLRPIRMAIIGGTDDKKDFEIYKDF